MPQTPIHASVVTRLLAVTALAWSLPASSTERGKIEARNRGVGGHGPRGARDMAMRAPCFRQDAPPSRADRHPPELRVPCFAGAVDEGLGSVAMPIHGRCRRVP